MAAKRNSSAEVSINKCSFKKQSKWSAHICKCLLCRSLVINVEFMILLCEFVFDFSNKFVILIFETFNFIDKSNFKKITILLIIFTYSVKFFFTLIIIFKKNRILYDFYTKISNKLMGIYLNTSYSNSIKTKLYQKINTLSGEVENFVSTLIDAIVIIILEFKITLKI